MSILIISAFLNILLLLLMRALAWNECAEHVLLNEQSVISTRQKS